MRTQEKKKQAAALMKANDLVGALSLFTQVVTVDPNDAQVWELLGSINGQMGRLEDSLVCSRKAIALRPDSAGAHSNLGMALHELGRLDEAVASLKQAIRLDPGQAIAANALGLALCRLGQPQEGAIELQRATRDNPAQPLLHANLGTILRALGQHAASLNSCCRAIELDPQNGEFHANFVESLRKVSSISIDAPIIKAIHSCFENTKLDHTPMTAAVVSVLRVNEQLARLLELAKQSDQSGLESEVLDDRYKAVFHNRMFHDLLRFTKVCDIEFEVLLTALRRISLKLLDTGEITQQWILADSADFLTALACQSFNNDYVFSVSDDELESIGVLNSSINERLNHPIKYDIELGRMVTVAAMYQPLSSIKGCERLLELKHTQTPAPLLALIARQVKECLDEREIAQNINPISGISDCVSAAVREQYEESPYPRWLNILSFESYSPPVTLQSKCPNITPPNSGNEQIRILVAGCGTGKHPIYTATHYLGAQVLAIDLSRNSLAYAKRKSRELGVDNIEFAHGDILELNQLADRFDLIESVGVLHHLKNPLDGWRVLTNLLKPNGIMRIGLYSQLARRSIHQARDYFHDMGFSATPAGIREARQALLSNKPDLAANFVKTEDFFSVANCRDLFFNVQEKCFTIPEIAHMLEELGLVFLGFEFYGDGQTIQRFRERYGPGAPMRDLDKWHSFEQIYPDTFLRMYEFYVQHPA